MSIGEILLTLIIALMVFGPKKLPMLAENIGRLLRVINQYKEKASKLYHEQLAIEQLKANSEMAQKADKHYEAHRYAQNDEKCRK